MGLNPKRNKEDDDWIDKKSVGLEGADVTRSPSHTQGDNKSHAVYVRPDTMDRDLLADVSVSQTGDVEIPEEGSRVVIGYRVNERPVVVGQRYTQNDYLPDFDPGERIVGHPLSDSYIKLAKDGSVTVEGDNGNTIELQSDGDIVLNGGATQAVKDVVIDETNAEGGATSLNVSRSNSIYIP